MLLNTMEKKRSRQIETPSVQLFLLPPTLHGQASILRYTYSTEEVSGDYYDFVHSMGSTNFASQMSGTGSSALLMAFRRGKPAPAIQTVIPHSHFR